MTTRNYYKVYCNTEAKYLYEWRDDVDGVPTSCPVNITTEDEIDEAKTELIQTINPANVNVDQEDNLTGGHFGFSTQKFIALADQITSYTFSYPIPISMLEASYVSAEENRGDTWSWLISPNTVVGALTANVAVSDTVISVSPTVMTYMTVGFYMALYDGVNTENLGMVLSKDTVNSTITVQNASSQIFLAATPTYVRMNIYFCKDMEFGHPWSIDYGSNKIKTTYVPANTVINVQYTNNSPSVDKTIVVYIQYMY